MDVDLFNITTDAVTSSHLQTSSAFTSSPPTTDNITEIFLSDFRKYVDDTTAFYFKMVMFVSACGAVSTVGIATNAINMVVFVRQGVFSESSTTSLFCLAFCDFWCVTTALWVSISFGMHLTQVSGLDWKPYDIMYLTGAWPHLMCAQMTRMVTAFVALERCICVVFPFKVKIWLTPKRAFGVNIGLLAYCLLSYSPLFITQQLRFIFDPSTNQTKLSLYFTEHRQYVLSPAVYTNAGINTVAVAVVSLCTAITVSRVRLSKTWRNNVSKMAAASPDEAQDSNPSSGKDKKDQIANANKEEKLIKIVTTISTIFLICFAPDFLFFLTYMVDPDIRVLGPYDNLANVMFSITFFLETVNSSINLFVYYKMSSRYKQELDYIFGRRSRVEGHKT